MSALKLEINSNDHHTGNLNASLTLVEYADFQCPSCRRSYSLVKRLLKEMSNDLHFIFRNFPMSQYHRHAYDAAAAAEAAGKQGKFWQMHDLIFENQDKLGANYLTSLVEELGLDRSQFAIDRRSDEVRKKIEMDFESGIHSGVNGTPTFFLNGISILTFNGTYESLLGAILLELNVKQQ